MKQFVVITGGAGFIGSNLISRLLEETDYYLISLDNYFSGSKKNHIINQRVKYFECDTKNIAKKLDKFKNKLKCIFHFGEFSRIAQSFDYPGEVINSNIHGTTAVIEFCRINKIKIIYSATSSAFGNNFKDQNLSPYAFTKTHNLNMILNYHDWFNLQFEIIYFYNVYGSKQIGNKKMGAVIGIFEDYKKKGLALPIVRPGTQKRYFTHIDDTIDTCIFALIENKNTHYSIRSKSSYTIFQIAKMFKSDYKLISERPGERYNPSFLKKVRGKKVIEKIGKVDLKDYIKNL